MKCNNIILVLLFGLTACQPQGSYLYRFPAPQEHQIGQVMVVIDYLNLRDDVGKYWDFDSHFHQKTLNKLLADIDFKLQQTGYPKTESYLLSSGLLIKNEFAVEHYINEQLQDQLLYPPFILAELNTDAKKIEQHQEFLTLMVKYIGQKRHHENDENTHRGMQMGHHFASMDLPDNTAIFYLHVNQSAPGIIKQLGTLLISGAIANQADYGHVNMGLSSNRHASAFLIHKGSGQILWKNHSTSWTTDQPINGLLTALPMRQP